jgi:hypothetical protein
MCAGGVSLSPLCDLRVSVSSSCAMFHWVFCSAQDSC